MSWSRSASPVPVIDTKFSVSVIFSCLAVVKSECIGSDFHRAMVASAPGRTTLHRAPTYEDLGLRHRFAHLFS